MLAPTRLLLALCLLGGCATTGPTHEAPPPLCVLRHQSTHASPLDRPTKQMVVAAMHKVQSEVGDCFARFHQPGTVEACFDVAADGTPENVGSAGDLAGTEEARCVEAVMRKVRFEPVAEPWSFAYPLMLR